MQNNMYFDYFDSSLLWLLLNPVQYLIQIPYQCPFVVSLSGPVFTASAFQKCYFHASQLVHWGISI